MRSVGFPRTFFFSPKDVFGPRFTKTDILDFLEGDAAVKRRRFLRSLSPIAANPIAAMKALASAISAIPADCRHPRSQIAIQIPNYFWSPSGHYTGAVTMCFTENRHRGTETRTI
jgi:hypothetical protein